MPRAIWNNVVIADADATVIVEGNHYFPAASVNDRYHQPADRTSVCPWKGRVSYVALVVDGAVDPATGWLYPDPKDGARNIAGHIVFGGE